MNRETKLLALLAAAGLLIWYLLRKPPGGGASSANAGWGLANFASPGQPAKPVKAQGGNDFSRALGAYLARAGGGNGQTQDIAGTLAAKVDISPLVNSLASGVGAVGSGIWSGLKGGASWLSGLVTDPFTKPLTVNPPAQSPAYSAEEQAVINSWSQPTLDPIMQDYLASQNQFAVN